MKGEMRKALRTSQRLSSHRRGQLGGAPAQIIMFVIMIIVLALGGYTVNEIGSTFTENTTARNITDKGGEGLYTYSKFTPIIAIVLVVALIIIILLGSLAVFGRQ